MATKNQHENDSINKLRIFIASSSELKEERTQFILALAELNKSFLHLHLEPTLWELDGIRGNVSSDGVIQDGITPILENSDIVIALFYSKLGAFTKTEYDQALRLQKKIFLYFKEGFSPKDTKSGEEYLKLLNFKNEVDTDNKVLYETFESPEDFNNSIQKELRKYLSKLYDKQINSSKEETKVNQREIIWIHHSPLETQFVGREKEIKKINHMLTSEVLSGQTKSIISLISIGGIGKTCLTRQCIETIKNSNSAFSKIIWFSFVEAKSEDRSFLFRSILQRINPTESEAGLNEKKDHEYFREKVETYFNNSAVLLVLDNCELIQNLDDRNSNKFGKIKPEFNSMLNFLKAACDFEKSKILITSRTGITDLINKAAHEEIKLDTFTPEDGGLLLKKIGVPGNSKECQELSKLLGNHALCLKAAGNVITRKKIKAKDFKDFIGPKVFNTNEEGEKIIEILNLYKDLLSEDQEFFLKMMSLHIRGVSEENFPILINNYDNYQATDKHRAYDEIITPLCRLGLIEEQESDDSTQYNVHPLMKFAYTTWFKEPTEEAYETLALSLISKAEGTFYRQINSVEDLQIYLDIIFYYIHANKPELAFQQLEDKYEAFSKYKIREKIYQFVKDIERTYTNISNWEKIILFARIAENAKDCEEKVKYWYKSLHSCEEEDDEYRTSEVSKLLAISLIQNGFLSDAQNVIADYQLQYDDYLIGLFEFYSGNYDNAMLFLQKAYNLEYDQHQKRRIAQRLAPILMYLEEYETANQLATVELKNAIDIDDACCIIPLYEDVIILYLKMGALNKAEELHTELMKYCHVKGLQLTEVYEYLLIKKDYKALIEKLSNLLATEIENHDKMGQIYTNFMMAKSFVGLNDVSTAHQKYDVAIQLMNSTKACRHKYFLKEIIFDKM